MTRRVEITVTLDMNGGETRQNALALHLLTSLQPVLGTDGWYGIDPNSVTARVTSSEYADGSDGQ